MYIYIYITYITHTHIYIYIYIYVCVYILIMLIIIKLMITVIYYQGGLPRTDDDSCTGVTIVLTTYTFQKRTHNTDDSFSCTCSCLFCLK